MEGLPGSGLAELNTLSRWAKAAYLSARAGLMSPPAAVELLCEDMGAKDPKSALHDLGKWSKCAKVAAACPAAAAPPAWRRRREMAESDERPGWQWREGGVHDRGGVRWVEGEGGVTLASSSPGSNATQCWLRFQDPPLDGATPACHPSAVWRFQESRFDFGKGSNWHFLLVVFTLSLVLLSMHTHVQQHAANRESERRGSGKTNKHLSRCFPGLTRTKEWELVRGKPKSHQLSQRSLQGHCKLQMEGHGLVVKLDDRSCCMLSDGNVTDWKNESVRTR